MKNKTRQIHGNQNISSFSYRLNRERGQDCGLMILLTFQLQISGDSHWGKAYSTKFIHAALLRGRKSNMREMSWVQDRSFRFGSFFQLTISYHAFSMGNTEWRVGSVTPPEISPYEKLSPMTEILFTFLHINGDGKFGSVRAYFLKTT